MQRRLGPDLNFLPLDSLVSELILRHDWAATPVGPVESWPQSLRTALGMILHSKFPTYMVWARDLISFCNSITERPRDRGA